VGIYCAVVVVGSRDSADWGIPAKASMTCINTPLSERASERARERVSHGQHCEFAQSARAKKVICQSASSIVHHALQSRITAPDPSHTTLPTTSLRIRASQPTRTVTRRPKLIQTLRPTPPPKELPLQPSMSAPNTHFPTSFARML
jgi:hypothetical protein